MIRPSSNPVTLLFGATTAPYSPQSPHIGVDFASEPDDGVYAPENGEVTLVHNDPLMGNAVHIYVGNRHHALCHLSKFLVTNGQQIQQGEKVGIMGYSGYVVPPGEAGTHLHWALTVDGSLIDPLSAVEGNKMYPNEGDVINFWNALGRGTPNQNDIAYWTTGTGNPAWDKGADATWKAFAYELTNYAHDHPNVPGITPLKPGIYEVKG